MYQHLERAEILMDQNRFEAALAELNQALAMDPENALVFAKLALCYQGLQDRENALGAARESIRLEPDQDYHHYVYAFVLHQWNYEDAALGAVEKALSLDPEDPAYHALQGSIFLAKRRWKKALAAADRGLALNAEDQQAMHVRALALKQMGRGEEAAEILHEALKLDPDNADNHANMGWQLVDQGDYDQAQYHFTEALRIQPDMTGAQAGMAEILKAKNPIYRLLLRYQLWMSKLSGNLALGLIVGLYFLNRFLRSMAESNPSLAPWVTPILVVYAAFLALTWLGDPIFNLLLRLHPIGKYCLDKTELMASTWTGALMLLTLIGGLAWLLSGIGGFGGLALVSVAMLIPVSSSIGRGKAKGGKALRLFAAILGVIAALTVLLAFIDIAIAAVPGVLLFLGVIAYSWTASIMSTR